jgi:undecaprenyl-diphosphatase
VADWWQALVLAVLQGVTEFLPVSSSAHLILPAQILGWPDQGLMVDVSVHAGTLLAVIYYFRATMWHFVVNLVPGSGSDRTELWNLCIATAPVVVAGVLLKEVIATEAREVLVIACATIIFGLLLGWADHQSRRCSEQRVLITPRDAFFIGLAQMFALIPGTSRSGVTITAALFLGYPAAVATRFSFLLSIPVITGASIVMLLSAPAADVTVTGSIVLPAVIASAIFAYATISLFMAWVERAGLMPFVIYRLILGMVLLAWAFR